jgi:Protein of unknown function (DUF2786)
MESETMTQTTPPAADEGTLRRLKKLLALGADSAAAPGEAANAMRMAQNLMAKHGLTTGDIVAADITETLIQSTKAVTPPPWEGFLLSEICRAFGARNLWCKGWGPRGAKLKGHHLIIAPKQRIELITYAFEVVRRQLVKARAEYLTTLPVWYTRPMKADHGDQFGLGFVYALSKKISDFADDPLMVTALDEKKAKRTTGKYENRKLNAGTEALHAGSEAGEAADLHKPMTGREEQLRLGSGA